MHESDIVELIKDTVKRNLVVNVHTAKDNFSGVNLHVDLSFRGEDPFYRDTSYIDADYSEEEWMGDINKRVTIEIG
jgi:hypothetical protein